MKLLLRFWFIISILIGFQSAWAMNFAGSDFPAELKELIFKIFSGQLDQAVRIQELAKLRRVCKRWNAILTDAFIADVVGIADQAEQVPQALFEAIKQGNLKMVEFIGKTFPAVIRTLQKIPHYWVPIEGQPNAQHCSPYFSRAVRILLSYGLNPQVTVWEIELNGRERIFFEGGRLLDAMVWFLNKDARASADLLLEHATDAQKSLAFHVAVGQPNMYMLPKLIHYCGSVQEAEDACNRLMYYSGACCQTHLQPVMEELIRRGANEHWRTYLSGHPINCEGQDWDILPDHRAANSRHKPAVQTLIQSIRASKIPYLLVGTILGCCILYKYWWLAEEEETDEDAQDVSESDDEANFVTTPVPV